MRGMRAGTAAALILGLGACSPTSGEGGGSALRNIFLYGGTTVPPAAATADEEVYCPRVGVIDGGAALRAYAGQVGDYQGLRNQLSLTGFARECSARPDGSIVVKVGVEGRALLGPAGGAGGRFDAPIRFVIKRGDQILATRAQRIPVSIPPGETGVGFTAVESGLVVPPGVGEFDIEVGLGSPGPERPARRRRG